MSCGVGASTESGTSGSRTTNEVRPAWLDNVTSPPCALATAATIARPRPLLPVCGGWCFRSAQGIRHAAHAAQVAYGLSLRQCAGDERGCPFHATCSGRGDRDVKRFEPAPGMVEPWEGFDERSRVEIGDRLVEPAQQPAGDDEHMKQLESQLAAAQKPLPPDDRLQQMRRSVELSEEQLKNKRLTVAQDVVWALINTPAFLYNH